VQDSGNVPAVREGIAWAAGLFEGEGCFHYSAASTHIRASLNMTDYAPVEQFMRIVGIGKVRIQTRPSPRHQDQMHWDVSNRPGVIHVFELLRPWLSERRVAQAERALAEQGAAIARAAIRRATACKNGHPRTPENTQWIRRSGRPSYRSCKECARLGRVRRTSAEEPGA
jgi:hypothetical protein